MKHFISIVWEKKGKNQIMLLKPHIQGKGRQESYYVAEAQYLRKREVRLHDGVEVAVHRKER